MIARKFFLSIVVLVALSRFAFSAAPTYTVRLDSQHPEESKDIKASQGASVSLKIFSYSDGEKNTLTTDDAVVLGYGTNWDLSASMARVYGTADTNAGAFVVNMAPSNLPASGSFFYQVLQTNSATGDFYVLGQGILNVARSPITTGGSLTLTQVLNWDLFSYLGTPPYPRTFLGLTDTPSTYSGQAGKSVVVNGTGTGLEFSAAGAGDVVAGSSNTFSATNTASALWHFNGGFTWFGTNFDGMIQGWNAGISSLQGSNATVFAWTEAVSNLAQEAYDTATINSNALANSSSRWDNAGTAATAASNLSQSAYDTSVIVSNWGPHTAVGYLTAGSNVSSLVNDSAYVGGGTNLTIKVNDASLTNNPPTYLQMVFADDNPKAVARGMDSATYDGVYSIAGIYNGKPYYSNIAGNRFLHWVAAQDRWFAGVSLGATNRRQKTPDAEPYGLYEYEDVGWVDSGTFYETSGNAENAKNATNATYATVANTASNVPPSLTNYFRNAANHTNETYSWGGMLDRYPTGALDNVYVSSAATRAGTITNISTYSDGGTLVGDLCVNYWSNRTYSLVYTGLTWTVAASNIPVSISWPVDSVVFFRITNGIGTNAYGSVRYTR